MTGPAEDRRGVGGRVAAILAAGVAVRLALLYALADLPLRMDEIQYQELAVNLTQGRGFMLNDSLSSWRPPLYPFVLSVVYGLLGTTAPVWARALQMVLSLANALVVYWLGRRLFGDRVGLVAMAIFTFYPSFLLYNNHLLTEVLFTFLVTVTVAGAAAYAGTGRLGPLVAGGIALGLATLTREMIWPVLGFLALLAWSVARGDALRWARHTAALLLAFAVVVTPWVIRNTRLQGTFTLVATNGGIVFMEGNYEHTPLDRPWRSHALKGEVKVRRLLPDGLSEAERQRVAFRRGLAFIRENPVLSARRAAIKAANVWGLERALVGALLKGDYGSHGKLVLVAVTVLIMGAYAATILAGVAGLSLAIGDRRPGLPVHLLVAGLAVFVTLGHALVFGHPRYHLPLMPLFAVYAAYAWSIRGELWGRRGSPAFVVACGLAGLLVASWAREVFLVELERFLRAVGGA